MQSFFHYCGLAIRATRRKIDSSGNLRKVAWFEISFRTGFVDQDRILLRIVWSGTNQLLIGGLDPMHIKSVLIIFGSKTDSFRRVLFEDKSDQFGSKQVFHIGSFSIGPDHTCRIRIWSRSEMSDQVPIGVFGADPLKSLLILRDPILDQNWSYLTTNQISFGSKHLFLLAPTAQLHIPGSFWLAVHFPSKIIKPLTRLETNYPILSSVMSANLGVKFCQMNFTSAYVVKHVDKWPSFSNRWNCLISIVVRDKLPGSWWEHWVGLCRV